MAYSVVFMQQAHLIWSICVADVTFVIWIWFSETSILLGWTIYFMDLIKFPSFSDDLSTLRTKIFIRLGRSIHFMVLWTVHFVNLFSHPFGQTVHLMDLRTVHFIDCFSSCLDDPSTLWTLFLIRPQTSLTFQN